MKKFLVVLIALTSLSAYINAQSLAPSRYWIQFSDKNNSPYSTSNPSAFLTPRAIQRRLTRSIPIDYHDLPVNQSYVDSLVAKGAHIHCRSKWFNGVVVQLTSTAQLTAIQALPFVVSSTAVGAIQQNPNNNNQTEKFREYRAEAPPRRKQESRQMDQLNYGLAYNQINMLGGICLHNQGYQGQGMVIALLDAGFFNADTLAAFDSLRVNNQILGTWDFVAETSNVYTQHFHGMMVLSCIGGNLPGQLVGTAPKAKFWLLRTEEAATEYIVEEYNWAAGAEFADSVGADVINTSLGYTQFDDSTENHTYADMNGHKTPCARAVNYASNRGMAIVCSAGNSGTSPWRMIGTPADADSSLTVAAVDGSGNYASFSSHGPAYGGNVKPDVAAQGQGAVVADYNSNGVLFENGTSFSSPIMCGLVTCLWQAHPTMTNMELFHAIEQTGNQFSSPDTLLGYGIPNFCSPSLGVNNRPDLAADYLSTPQPNPFTSNFQFIFWSGSAQTVTVCLYDLNGKLISRESRVLAPESFNTFESGGNVQLDAGVYLLSVQTEKEVYNRKLVKQ